MLSFTHPSQISTSQNLTDQSHHGIRSFQSEYPLPATLGAPDVYVELVDAADVLVRACGIACEHQSGRIVTGAAAELSADPGVRSYFELLERAAVLDFTQSSADEEPTATGAQRFAVSNGVAVALDAQGARFRALAELVERDRVLRSFYGELAPERLRLDPHRILPGPVARHYELEAYRFPATRTCATTAGQFAAPLEVAAIFGFPVRPGAPLLFGFGARLNLADALAAAVRESLHQLAFGWGEPVPDVAPAPSPTPEFHLDYFAYPPHRARLRRWLAGEHLGRGPELPARSAEPRYLDITPNHLQGKLAVVKCVHDGALPLAFGEGHPLLEALPDSMRVHPIA
ncbi:MAG TPA: YcaO-like family protein [Polyangiaceae bacterium]